MRKAPANGSETYSALHSNGMDSPNSKGINVPSRSRCNAIGRRMHVGYSLAKFELKSNVLRVAARVSRDA